jgi:hypothetical protein
MSDSQLHRVLLSKLTERIVRMGMVVLPGFGGLEQETLRDLRTPDPQARPESQPVQSHPTSLQRSKL